MDPNNRPQAGTFLPQDVIDSLATKDDILNMEKCIAAIVLQDIEANMKNTIKFEVQVATGRTISDTQNRLLPATVRIN